jgi:hypothetical protein
VRVRLAPRCLGDARAWWLTRTEPICRAG